MHSFISRFLISDRVSPISLAAASLTLGLGVVAITCSALTQLSFVSIPNLMPLVLAVFTLDLASKAAPQSLIIRAMPPILYGVLYLAITSLFAILAIYATQRFAFPLQDDFMQHADEALGFDWLAWAHWVDNHRIFQALCLHAYDSMSLQIVLPVVVLALQNRLTELRIYLLAFSLALDDNGTYRSIFPDGKSYCWDRSLQLPSFTIHRRYASRSFIPIADTGTHLFRER